MAQVKNLVIGAVNQYIFNHIEPWLISLKRTDYDGDIALACFNMNKATIDKLKSYNVRLIGQHVDGEGNIVYHQTEGWNVCVERFRLYKLFLDQNYYEQIIATDVKDVIFQRNPFDDIQNFHSGIVMSNEYLTYRNEPWGVNNIAHAFPLYVNDMMDRPIINAGVIAGQHASITSLFGMIWTYSQSTIQNVPGGGGPDQAAYNILMSRYPWNLHADYAPTQWACQAGTQADPNKIDKFRPHLLTQEPIWDGQYVLNNEGIKYAIVHQYDRVPLWNNKIDRMYRE